jgi:hypothetical protein
MVNIPVMAWLRGFLSPDLGLSCRRVRVWKTLCLLWRKVHGRSSVTSPTENFSRGRRHDAFEELGIHHEEHKVPLKVLKSIEEKANKVSPLPLPQLLPPLLMMRRLQKI